mmetsp:Transcript_11065/g.17046  ORF Transcript_11065/g.17046 Transcript_11065/m.17046 type:complete len:1017 (+) Transcript_11065:91-3141(+)
MENQVAEAALAMVRPTTDSSTRSAASSFLEQWTRTSDAWPVYVKWLQSFHIDACNSSNDANPERLGMQLLCLTLLLAKIRREVPRNAEKNSDMTTAIQNELWSFLQSTQAPELFSPLCSCLTALVVRNNQIDDLLVKICPSQESLSKPFTEVTSLRILASLPPELESCGDLTIPQVTSVLFPYVEIVLDTIRKALVKSSSASSALECLKAWIQTCHITLSQLNSTTCGGTDKLLPVLIQILSQSSECGEGIWISASHALTESILIPADSCTPIRQAAVAEMISAVSSQGFIAGPFQNCVAQDWDDGAHALATLMCTLVSEEVDDLCAEPADAYIGFLLQIQEHPRTQVALTVLDCWLTVQDIPTNSRHEHWREALFERIAEGLVKRVSYTNSFATWEDELDLDEQEFTEYRRMVTDVLINCYFLLRVKFLRQMVNVIFNAAASHDWTLMESALFSLAAIFREVCARLKAKGSLSSLVEDRTETAQEIIRLVEQLCGSDSTMAATAAAQQHVLVLGAACQFMGLYAPAWNLYCSEDAIFRILAYLHAAVQIQSTSKSDLSMVSTAASRAIKSIYISCAKKLLLCNSIFSCMQASMEGALLTEITDAMAAVAEGCTRLTVQMKDSSHIARSFESVLMPLLQRSEVTLNNITNDGLDDQRQLAADTLTKYLHVLHVVIRFCDTQSDDKSPLTSVLTVVWPLLEKSAIQGMAFESILKEVLAVHKQILSNIPKIMASRFSEVVKFVVGAFEKSKHPCTLGYIACAVESFSPMNSNDEKSFQELLAHVTKVTTTYLTTEKRPDMCPDLIQAFFEMNQRYIIFCPVALLGCTEFSNIVSLAIECLTECKGERESTRATLNFLGQLFGWRSLRLSDTISHALQNNASIVDEQIAKYGKTLTNTCINGLAGGPQMLWPAISDCVIAIISNFVVANATGPVVSNNTIAHEWIYSSLCCCNTSTGSPLPTETCQHIMNILFTLVQKGSKSKPKAKMLLTDYAKICKGEMAKDALLSYSLDANDVQH